MFCSQIFPQRSAKELPYRHLSTCRVVCPASTADQMVLYMYLFACLLPIFLLLECKCCGNWGIPCAGLG